MHSLRHMHPPVHANVHSHAPVCTDKRKRNSAYVHHDVDVAKKSDGPSALFPRNQVVGVAKGKEIRGGRTYDIIARHTPPPALLAAAPATAFSRPARRRMSSYRHSAAPHAARQSRLHASKAHHVVILGRGGLLLPLFAHILLHAPPHFPQLLGDLHHCQLRVGLLHLLPMLVGEHYKCCSRPLGCTLPKHRSTPPAHPSTGRQPGDQGGEEQGRACARDRHSRTSGDAPRPLPACFASCACWACRASSSRVRVASPRGSGASTCTGTGSRRMVDMEKGPQPRPQPRRSGKAGRGSVRAAATSFLPPPLSAPVWPPVLPSSPLSSSLSKTQQTVFFLFFVLYDNAKRCLSLQPDPAALERGRGRLRPRFKHLEF